MICWEYENKIIKSLEDFPENTFGFVYEIEFSNKKRYVGSKFLHHKKTLKPLKNTKRKRKTTVESDWKTYIGSVKDENFLEEIKTNKIYPVKKIILKLCFSSKNLSYWETKYLFLKDCLENNNYYNNNILGKYYRKDLKLI